MLVIEADLLAAALPFFSFPLCLGNLPTTYFTFPTILQLGIHQAQFAAKVYDRSRTVKP
jgi:hypothetical protein